MIYYVVIAYHFLSSKKKIGHPGESRKWEKYVIELTNQSLVIDGVRTNKEGKGLGSAIAGTVARQAED